MRSTDAEQPPTGEQSKDSEEKNTRSCGHSLPAWWNLSMDRFRGIVRRCILVVARHAAVHPYIYAIGIALFSFGIMGIGLATNFDMNMEPHDYVTPRKSVIREQRPWVHENFPPWPRSLRVLIHKGGDNMLTTEGVLRAFEVVETIDSVEGYQIFCEKSMAVNNFGSSGECHQRGITSFWNNSRAVFEAGVNSTVDVILAVASDKFPDGSTVDPAEIMGHVSYHYETIVSAKSLLMEMLIPATAESALSRSVDALAALMALRNEWHEDSTSPYEMELYLTNYSVEEESFQTVIKDLPLIPLVFVIMFLFTCLIFSTSYPPGEKKFKQRIFLGIGANVTVLLSLVTSYGMLFIIGKAFV
jgi:hypothetical protein